MSQQRSIGLTGPTGAGKSTAAQEFSTLGAKVIDCDKLGQEILDTPDCREQLCRAYGTEILGPDGTISRPKLAEKAFFAPGASSRLNAITHPLIMREIQERTSRFFSQGTSAVVIDAALLFESGADTFCTVTISVLASPKIRLERIMRRDGLTQEQAQARMNAQKNADYYAERSDHCLDGSGTPASLKEQTRLLYQKLLEE